MPDIPLVYASGKKDPEIIFVKNRINRWVRMFMERYAKNGEKEIIFHLTSPEGDLSQISLVDSKLDEQFKSNMEFEGQITELHNQLKKFKNENAGLKMRVGRQESQINRLKEKLKKYEDN